MAIDTIFNETRVPGTILKDINSFLNFIHNNELEVTGNKGLLPNHCLSKINLIMSHPLKLVLKREQQISYPHISALYLLSRTLGFIQIIQNKSKRFLMVNPETMSEWDNLNTVEKYFCLLQSWFFRCDERLINRGRHRRFSYLFHSVSQFVRYDLKTAIEPKSLNDQRWKIRIGLYNLALLEMFGLIHIKDNERSIEKSWSIHNISISDVGRELVQLFEKVNCDELFIQSDEEAMDQFYQKLAPFFSQWKARIEPKIKQTDNGIHFFKVSLSKKVWRRISIPGSNSLDDLSNLILDAFDFDHDHLYQFTYTDRFGLLKTINDYRLDDPPFSDEVKVGDIDMLIGDELEFLFDFGDYWLFSVQLEKIDNKLKSEKAKIIESLGLAPEQYHNYD